MCIITHKTLGKNDVGKLPSYIAWSSLGQWKLSGITVGGLAGSVAQKQTVLAEVMKSWLCCKEN